MSVVISPTIWMTSLISVAEEKPSTMASSGNKDPVDVKNSSSVVGMRVVTTTFTSVELVDVVDGVLVVVVGASVVDVTGASVVVVLVVVVVFPLDLIFSCTLSDWSLGVLLGA